MIEEVFKVKTIPMNEIKSLNDLDFNELSYQAIGLELEQKILVLRSRRIMMIRDAESKAEVKTQVPEVVKTAPAPTSRLEYITNIIKAIGGK